MSEDDLTGNWKKIVKKPIPKEDEKVETDEKAETSTIHEHSEKILEEELKEV